MDVWGTMTDVWGLIDIADVMTPEVELEEMRCGLACEMLPEVSQVLG